MSVSETIASLASRTPKSSTYPLRGASRSLSRRRLSEPSANSSLRAAELELVLFLADLEIADADT